MNKPDLSDIKIRDLHEIVRAHDMLDSIVEGDIPFRVSKDVDYDDTLNGMAIARNVLCWVLNHKREWFETRITEIEEFFAKGRDFK